MSVRAMALVWDLDLPRPEKFVLLAYTDHADHHGHNIWPAVGTIARKTGYSERAVQQITRSLEGLGLLIPDGQGPHGENRWRFPMTPPPSVGVLGRAGQGGENSAPPGAKSAGGGEPQFTPGVNPSSPEPSLKPSIEPPPRAAAANAWERYVGPLNMNAADSIEEMVQLAAPKAGGPQAAERWVAEAIQEARRSNSGRISPRYVYRILERWTVEGFKAPPTWGKDGRPAVPGLSKSDEELAQLTDDQVGALSQEEFRRWMQLTNSPT